MSKPLKIRYHEWENGIRCKVCGQGRPAKRSWIFKNSEKRAMGECPGRKS